jgi:transcriptional regulator with XRE-family HTH domain
VDLLPPAEAARRARAAIGYAGLDYDELVKATGIPEGTLRNITSKTRASGGRPERLAKIAQACEVPVEFMERGFAPLVDTTPSRLDTLERQVAHILRRLEAAEVPVLPDELDRPPLEPRRDVQGPWRSDTPGAGDSRRGSDE